MEGLLQLLPIVGIILLFWLFILRPASRRSRETSQMQSALEVGSEVVLVSGLYGTIRAFVDDRVMLEVAPDVTLQVARGAVGAVIAHDDGPDADHPDQTDDTVSDSSDLEER